MKILYYVPDLGVCNGVASYSMNYYEMLKSKMTIDFLITNDVETPYYDKIKKNGNNIFLMPKTKNIFEINSFLDSIFEKERYDAVHCHVINRGAIVLKRAKKHNVKIRILHSHTTKNGDTIFKRIIRLPFKQKALRYATDYFACSKLAGEFLFRKKKYIVINNAVIFGETKKMVENECYTFGTVGRFTLQKNPYFILKILKKLKDNNLDFKFIWVGSGELFEKIKINAKKMGIIQNIIFTGNTSNVIEYYSQMRLFILPSLYEGLPVVGVEAQYLGIPCLFSNKITSEILINDNVKSLSIKNVDIWAKEIISSFNNKKNICIKNNAIEMYDLNNNAKKLYDLYNELNSR